MTEHRPTEPETVTFDMHVGGGQPFTRENSPSDGIAALDGDGGEAWVFQATHGGGIR